MKWTGTNNMNCIYLLALVFASVLGLSFVEEVQAQNDFSSNFASYLNQAKSLLDTGMALQQQQQQQPVPSLMPNEDPRVSRLLSDSIKMATDLINNYRENGLSNMPNFPNLPGLNMVMRLPDKLLRAELSMLQDEIRMAQQMMQNPISATMNAPRDLASMFGRMAEQLEQ